MNIRWGTPTPLQIEDAKYRIMIPVRMFGQFAIQVAESKKLLIKLVGTTREFNQKTLSDCFKGILLTNIRDYVAKMFVQKEISILEIQSYLKEISNSIADDLRAEFTEYGLELVNFNVNEISVPENDPAYLELRKAKSERAKMDILGYNYQQERMFNVLDRAASNEGTSSAVMGAGMGLGMGLNVGNAVGGAMNEAINDNIKSPMRLTLRANADIPSGMKLSLGTYLLTCVVTIISSSLLIPPFSLFTHFVYASVFMASGICKLI